MKNLYIVFVDQFTCTFHRNSWSLVFYNRMPLCLDQGRHDVFFSGVVCSGLRETLHRLTFNMTVQDCARDCTDFHTTWLYRIAREIAQTYIQHYCTGLRERLHRLSYNMTVQDCTKMQLKIVNSCHGNISHDITLYVYLIIHRMVEALTCLIYRKQIVNWQR